MIAKPGVQEKILLHLLDYADFKEKVEVPFSLSQMGIANAVAIARSNVPRAISGLRDQGLLVERQAHVHGVSRKRKAYFLTDSGIIAAEDTWERLRQFQFRCIGSDGEALTTTLGSAHEVLPFAMRPVDIIRYLDDNLILDVRPLTEDLIERDLSKQVEKQLVTSLGDLPRLRHFYGREKELDNMVNLLEARATTLLVPGIAGIGKTTIAAKLIERFMHRRNLLYHRCQDWEGSRAMFEAIADWLLNIGDSSFSDYLAATPVPKPDDAARILVDSLENTLTLIVIDDFHKVSDPILFQTIQSMTLGLLGSEESIGLVIFSRSFKPVVPTKDAEGRITSLVLPLDGLDSESARHILSGFDDLSTEQWLHIHGLSRGHPLVLELINRGASAGAFHDTLEHYVTKEIFSKLTAEQKRVLTVLSIFRESVTLEALLAHELDVDVLDSLVEQGLARQVDTDVFDVHDLIREFLLQSLDERTKKEVHNSCAAYYAKQAKSSEATLEQIYHELASDHQKEAISKIVEFGRDIVSQGHLELLSLIEQVNTDGLKPKILAPMLQLQGDILLMLGRFEQASKTFEHASSASQSAGSEVIFSEILGSQADIAMKQGKTDSALESHKQALEVQVKLGDSKGAARTYNNMGYLYRRKNDKSKALAAYSEVESILSNDHSLLGAQIILGRALLDLGEVERARQHAFEAFERTDEGEDLLLHARAQALLGRYHAKMNDSETSLHHYSESLNVMSDAGDPVSLVEITILLGEVLEDSGRSEEALERYREALIIAEANDLRMQIGELLSKLGGVAPDRQRRMEYLQRALAVFRELGARTRMREVQAQVHSAVMGR